ncbi:MAG: transposase family protein [Candidatus Moranbacteria bacterium]|nr:transposase family protein [Candidatus Moranbacteria bacterium]
MISIEKRIEGNKRYIITFEDIYTRFTFAWSAKSHASQATKNSLSSVLRCFSLSIAFVLTDNGSEFAKEFSEAVIRVLIFIKNSKYRLF